MQKPSHDGCHFATVREMINLLNFNLQ